MTPTSSCSGPTFINNFFFSNDALWWLKIVNILGHWLERISIENIFYRERILQTYMIVGVYFLVSIIKILDTQDTGYA